VGIALIFPGQGSQKPKMGSDVYTASKVYRDILDEACRITGEPLVAKMHEGTEDDLKETLMAQLSVFCMSYGLYSILKTELPHIAALAGHSLGEYTALVVSEAISFSNAVGLVATRARLMAEATRGQDWRMSAVLGLDRARVDAVVTGIEDVWVANHNSTEQIVISGTASGVTNATDALTGDAKRILPLPVSGAFHTPLLKTAADKLIPHIRRAPIESPKTPVYANTDGLRIESAEGLTDELCQQMTSSVEWVNTLNQMRDSGIETFIEVGPGKVLTGLVKKTLPGATAISIGQLTDIENADFISTSVGG